MTNDLQQIRAGLEKAQVNTAKAESQRNQLIAQANEIRQAVQNKTQEAQDVAQKALAQVVDAQQSDEAMQNKAQAAIMQAQASALVKCSALWEKEHPHVNKKLEKCQII